MFERSIEAGVLEVLETEGIGCIAFSPLAQGFLTNRYLNSVPVDSRVNKPHGFLNKGDLTGRRLAQVRALNELAQSRAQSVAQVEENVAALANLRFSSAELAKIEAILAPQ